MSGLKEANDGLYRSWKSSLVHGPFYDGSLLGLSKDSEILACLNDNDVYIVDWTSGLVTESLFSLEDDSRERVSAFCLFPHSKDIVIATQNNLIRRINLRTKLCEKVFKVPKMPILCMDIDATGTLVATGSSDSFVRVWDVEKCFCTHSFKDHTDLIHLVRFHPNPYQLQILSTSEDSTIRIYDLNEKRTVACFREHMGLPSDISFSQDNYLLASCGRDKVLNFYELREMVHVRTVPLMEELEAVVLLNSDHSNCLLLNHKGQSREGSAVSGDWTRHVVISAGECGVLHVAVVSIRGKDIGTFSYEPMLSLRSNGLSSPPTHSPVGVGSGGKDQATVLQAVRRLLYAPTRAEIAVVNADRTIFTFHIQPVDTADVGNSAAGSPPLVMGRELVGDQDDVLDLVSIPNTIRGSLEGQEGVQGEESQAAHQFAVATNSTQVRLMSVSTFCCSSLAGHTDVVLGLDVSPDGVFLASASKDRSCRLWHLPSMSCTGLAVGHADAVNTVGLSQLGYSYQAHTAILVSGSSDKTLKRWSVPTASEGTKTEGTSLKCTHTVKAHDADITSVAVSANDALVASGSQDKTVRLWRSSDLTPLATLSGHKRGVWRVRFSPVDRCLASCSGDRTVRLWSVTDYSCLRTFQGHTSSVLALVFVNNGQQLLSGSSDGLIRVWTIRTGECESTLDKHTDKVWALAAPVSEGWFVSGGSDSSIVVWKDVTSEEERARVLAAEELLRTEQQMQNDLRNGRYGKALRAAITLKHPSRILDILRSILAKPSNTENGGGVDSGAVISPAPGNVDVKLYELLSDDVNALDRYVCEWSDEEIMLVVSYLLDWNTNARNTYVCQCLIGSLLRVFKLTRLLTLPSVVAAVPALLAYGERHYQRVDRLHQASYVIEFVQSQMTPQLLQPNLVIDNKEEERGQSKGTTLLTEAEKGTNDGVLELRKASTKLSLIGKKRKKEKPRHQGPNQDSF